MCPFTGLASDKKSKVTQITIYHNGMIINIKQPITCRDSYRLYVLSCKKPGCMKQYGGLTSRPVYIRFAEHLHDIRYGIATSPVGLHWQEAGHTVDHLEFIAVEKLGTRDKVTLRQREIDFINRMGVLEAGLNCYR